MARNETLDLVADTWTQLTSGNVTTITFQNNGTDPILVKGTVGANAPTDEEGAIIYESGEGEKNARLADLFPGVSGANRVYAKCADAGVVMVSHA